MSNDALNAVGMTVDIDQKSSVLSYAHVGVSDDIVSTLFNYFAGSLQKNASVPGFNAGNVPIAYVRERFQDDLVQNTAEVLLKILGINALFQFLRVHKHILATQPQLMDIHIQKNGPAIFTFEISKFDPPFMSEWRYLPFKAPGRKHYKDIDRQVESFIAQEKERSKAYKKIKIDIGDWVAFVIDLIDEDENSLIRGNSQQFWLLIGPEEADKPLATLFEGRLIGDSFITKNSALQEFFGKNFSSNLNFRIEIIDILPCAYFDLDLFKRHFRLKTNKQMQEKMIEVFSYRNDLSQRRTMAEQSLKTVLSRHKIVPPEHAVIRKQSEIWNRVRSNPDYFVYRAQQNFENSVKNLAWRQVCEQLLLDQVAFSENLNMNNTDVKGLLNLTNHPRMKEFIYFDLPEFRDENAVLQPIADEQIKNICLKEKALNHIIYHLTQA